MRGAFWVAALLAALPVAAQETTLWGQFDNWEVWVDPTQGNGCFAYVSYDDGSFFRAGYDNTDGSSHVFFSNPKWKSLAPGSTYTIRVYFDPIESYWDSDAAAQEFDDGMLFLRMDTSDPTLMDDVLKASTARIEFKGEEIASFDLSGSSRAINGVFDCQDDPANQGANSDDPFGGTATGDSGGTGPVTDPFAN